MIDTYFKMIGQKTGDDKIILVAVVDNDFMKCEEIPNIFEVQAISPAPTIYSGTYPTIKINLATLFEREDLKGSGIAGIIIKENWYVAKRHKEDNLGIGL